MSWLLTLLGKVLPALAVDATTRLVQAARESLRPKPIEAPPPIGESGAVAAHEYLRGAADEAWSQAERDRLKRSADELAAKAAQCDDDGPAEEPSDDGGMP